MTPNDFFDYQRLFGENLADAQLVVVDYDGEPFTIGVVLDFCATALVVVANSDDDSVLVIESAGCHPREMEYFAERDCSFIPSVALREFIGMPFLNLWRCENAPSYFDSIDMSFGDWNLPTVKFFCSASELKILKIVPFGS